MKTKIENLACGLGCIGKSEVAFNVLRHSSAQKAFDHALCVSFIFISHFLLKILVHGVLKPSARSAHSKETVFIIFCAEIVSFLHHSTI